MTATGIPASTASRPQPDIVPPGRPVARTRRAPQFGRMTPYWLALPTVAIVLGVFAYPLYRLIIMSFQHVDAQNLFRTVPPTFVGFRNYTQVLDNSQFWTVTARTIIFTLLTVAASVGLGLLIASLLNRISRWARLTFTVVLMFVWSVPQIVSIEIFNWLTDPNFSVVNWLLTKVGLDMNGHDWFRDPHQGLAVAGAVVVWGAVPFLAITLYAGMALVPKELLEAARMDGASAWRTFRAVTLPIIRPLLVIVTTLSVIWDVQVFSQIWLMRSGQPGSDFWTLSIYTYDTAIAGTNYNLASAIGVITVVLMLGVMVFYMRQIFRIGDND